MRPEPAPRANAPLAPPTPLGILPLRLERVGYAVDGKALIEEGRYVARSWIVAWPRAALIRWAGGRQAAESSKAA